MDSDDEYILQPSSDEGGIDSSDEDEMVLTELIRQSDSGNKISVKVFKSEMKNELDLRIAAYLKKEEYCDPLSSMSDKMKEKHSKHYFDTDSEEDDEMEDSTVVAKSNIELFYDPEMDLKDEKFVQNQRDNYRTKLTDPNKPKLLPNSDAVLNCPACFTTLCHDCQRHETIKTQYRAMFTTNHCQANLSEVMKIPLNSHKNRSKKDSSQPGELDCSGVKDVYHPVQCLVCNTHVAMLDSDEVYHFFNVVTSH